MTSSSLFYKLSEENKPKEGNTLFHKLAKEQQTQPSKKPEPPKEGVIKSTIRKALQVPLGYLKRYTWPADVGQMMGAFGGFDEEDIDLIQAAHLRAGKPFDREDFNKQIQNSLSLYPTQGNIERGLEEYTGLPLTPQDRMEKFLRLGSEVASVVGNGYTLRPFNTGLPAPILGMGVAGGSQALQSLGVNETISDILATGLIKTPTEGASRFTMGAREKPSGLIERRYESTSKPKYISENRKLAIEHKVEQDFKKVSDKIIETSPVKETNTKLSSDKSFKENVGKQFEIVSKQAENLPQTFPAKEIKTKLANRGKQVMTKGISPSEYQKQYNKELNGFVNQIKHKDITTKQLVEQYRVNNNQLTEYFEPGRSKAYNRGKKDAILDYNQSIAEIIENKFPDTEFSKLFKETNKTWTEINDIEFINEFIDDIFDKGIKHDKLKQLKDPNTKIKFKRALGKKGFKHFEQLSDDFMSTKQAYQYLRKAEKFGMREFSKLAMSFMIHPYIAAARMGYKVVKPMWQSLLDKPRLAVQWHEGIQAVKSGDFAKAESKFTKVQTELQTPNAIKKTKPIKSKPTLNAKVIPIKPKQLTYPKEFTKIQDIKPQKLPSIPSKPKQVIKDNVEAMARQDITRKGLKEQKDYFLSALEKALKNPPSGNHFIVKIPGDGTFKIVNNPKAIETAIKKVKTKWPSGLPYRKPKSINKPKI